MNKIQKQETKDTEHDKWLESLDYDELCSHIEEMLDNARTIDGYPTISSNYTREIGKSLKLMKKKLMEDIITEISFRYKNLEPW